MNRALRIIRFPTSMRGMLLLLVLATLVPLLIVQAGIYTAWDFFRWAENRRANLSEAQAAAATFDAYVRGIYRQQAAIGAALAGLNPYSAEQANAVLAATAQKYRSIRDWHWIDPQGAIITSSRAGAIGANVADEPWFREVQVGRPWTVGKAAVERPSGTPAFVVARRVEDAAGKLLGVVSAVVEAGRLEGRAVMARSGVGGSVVIFDQFGTLVHAGEPDSALLSDCRAGDPLLAGALESGEEAQGEITRSSDGLKVIAARVPMKESGWVAGADLPVRRAMSHVHAALWIAGGLNLLIAAGSAVAAVKIGGAMIGQMRRLQMHADAIGRGELGHSSECTGIGELAELAAAFNRMGEAVRNVHDAQQQSLHGQSRVLEAFFHHTVACLTILDRKFNFVHVNEAYANSCGRDMEEFPGLNHFALYPDAENEAIFREVVRAKKPYQAFAKPFVFPDHPEWGTTYWDWTLVPILNQAGEVDFLVFSLQDVTDRKRAEEELVRHREHLAELVARRTEELQETNRHLEIEIGERRQAEEALKRTAEQLARSNEDLAQFAYIASHDLQEPLRVVAGYVQLLARKYQNALDADADQFIRYIVDGAARMRQLIVDLLNYSRLDTCGTPFRPVAVQAVLDRVMANLKTVVEESGAAVDCDPLPEVNADETQLVQLFQNLIGNAIKFRGELPPRIRVSARRNADYWEFSVRDNGIGIEKEYWGQVFQVFQRLHTRQKYAGTGIGLAICKRIVERHRGRIWLDSRPGEGSTFYFTIP